MHGIPGIGPASTPVVLRALGLSPATSWAAADLGLRQDGFTYLPLDVLCPALMPLFDLRPILGVRSPANSFCRDLNPFAAACQIQGVFHPGYLPTHQATAQLLGQPRAAIFKGGGGEAQCNPEKPVRVATLCDGVAGEETWPASAPAIRHPWRDEELDPRTVVALWRGDLAAPGPEAAIIATTAIALKLCGGMAAADDALAQAGVMWRERPRTKYG
jgi:anthranilate phosphoribosyltransferase